MRIHVFIKTHVWGDVNKQPKELASFCYFKIGGCFDRLLLVMVSLKGVW